MSNCTKEITEQHIQLSTGLGARVVPQVSLQKVHPTVIDHFRRLKDKHFSKGLSSWGD